MPFKKKSPTTSEYKQYQWCMMEMNVSVHLESDEIEMWLG